MEKYKIEIKQSASKEIRKLPKSDLKKILLKIEDLAVNPRPRDCKKLSNAEKYRVRCGVYRIVYTITDDILKVYIVKVAHRAEIYK